MQKAAVEPEESPVYAHSLPGRPLKDWEELSDHLTRVAERAAVFASAFEWSEAARLAGQLHDVGKVSAQFQAYIRDPQALRGGDHSTAGARIAQRYPVIGPLLAAAIAGHHAGLPDGHDLARRLDPRHAIAEFAGWEAQAGRLPEPAALAPPRSFRRGDHAGFAAAFLGRMLFSCLVDADFLETEAFYARAAGEPVARGQYRSPRELLDRLRAFLPRLRADTALDALRTRVRHHAVGKAFMSPGLFTLTVPTGGGKTLTSLAFALEHAVRHGLRRVVYVIPLTSIIEQTAQVFRGALDSDDDVLEHHASFDWDKGAADIEGADAMARLRRAAENWDAPIIVTTAVQFFESLFAARVSRCRKLHHLAGAVIVLDEAQTLPVPLLRPCMAAIGELARNYGSTVVLCTATQPALRRQDGFKLGLDIPAERELAPDPPSLYVELKRVQVTQRAGKTEDAEIAARFAEQPQMLCVVNSRAHAGDLFGRIRGLEGAVHLTTLMCPRHRRMVLAGLRQRLGAGLPVRLVATSLIEAGVDIDFPEVWRASAGLDQIAQAAGRCNREGRLSELGRVVVFEPAEYGPPHVLRAAQQVAEGVLRRHADPLTLEAVSDYFKDLYWTKGDGITGDDAFDAATLGKGRDRYPILPAIAECKSRCDFPFATIAKAFRMINQAMQTVIVPWGPGPEDTEAKDLLGRIAAMDCPLARDLRRLQQYVVPVPQGARDLWLGQGVLKAVHRALGDTVLCFENDALYDPDTGLRLADPTWRSAELNVF